MLNLKEITLQVGAEEPFEALHISDTHLTLADGREQDNGRKLELAQNRRPFFSEAEENLAQAQAYAGQHNLPI